jgi:EAL domain-containing protein (putative c-di-GMP-specific phosphodiesterase class I)/CheY-like chemotaxis protein
VAARGRAEPACYCASMGIGSEKGGDLESSILVVDDDDILLAALQRGLSRPNVRVKVAGSGETALLELAAHPFDALVSDLKMPGMNGLKLLHAVREHDLDLPVILMTGNPDLKSAAAAIEYGAFQYLIKPIAIERLRAVVDRAVNVGRIARVKRECAAEFGSGSFYVGDRAGIGGKLNRALSSLWIAYQPIVRAADGAIFGYEALLRSEEPMLPHPGAVLKAAEKVGRVHDVGRAVRDLVAMDLERAGNLEGTMFVNLHPVDLMDPALYLPGAPLTRIAQRVVLELNDRASLEQVSDVLGRVERLRTLGFRIAIDDMGAGQADPAMFTQLEPEFVKLDLSVIRGVDHDPAKKKIVQSMVRLCHNLGKVIIAEGVETTRERDTLVEAGCDFWQGYLFGRPGPLQEPNAITTSA